MKICVTGHRPNKLYGYNIFTKEWIDLRKLFMKMLVENNCEEAITGIALAVLDLKEKYNIKLHCAIPCKNQCFKWSSESIKLYNYILSKADIVKFVSNEEYKPWLMQRRNEYMVDLADKVVAVWDGSKSGTGNCVEYAIKCNKEIIVIKPTDIL